MLLFTSVCIYITFLLADNDLLPACEQRFRQNPQGPQTIEAKDATVAYYMNGRLLLSATDAFGCI